METTTVSTMAIAPMALTVPVWPTTVGSTASTGTVSCSVGSPFAVQVRQALLLFFHPKVTHPARMVPVTMATAPATMATPESVVTRVRHWVQLLARVNKYMHHVTLDVFDGLPAQQRMML